MTDRNLIPGTVIETVIASVDRQFDAVDRLGRDIGTRVTILSAEYVAATDAEIAAVQAKYQGRYSGPVIEAAHAGKTRFVMRPHATRNGAPYGAWRYGSYFDTRAEAEAAAQKHIDTARKRAAKTVAK